jgi:hypothetical protein
MPFSHVHFSHPYRSVGINFKIVVYYWLRHEGDMNTGRSQSSSRYSASIWQGTLNKTTANPRHIIGDLVDIRKKNFPVRSLKLYRYTAFPCVDFFVLLECGGSPLKGASVSRQRGGLTFRRQDIQWRVRNILHSVSKCLIKNEEYTSLCLQKSDEECRIFFTLFRNVWWRMKNIIHYVSKSLMKNIEYPSLCFEMSDKE